MYTKKTIIFNVIILTLFIAPFIAQNVHAQTFTILITPATQTVGIGQTVNANVSITGVGSPGIYSYQLDVVYNNTLLNATSAQIPSDHFLKPSDPSKIFPIGPTIDQTAGTITVAVTLLGDEAGKTGGGTLITMSFVGLAQGIATLSLQNMILVDGNGNQIASSSYAGTDGSIEIIPEFALVMMMAVFGVTTVAAAKMRRKLK
jgi:hypothetical protein